MEDRLEELPADRPYVVAIAGTSGSGKSSLVHLISERLSDGQSLHFDHYASVSRYPPDLGEWLRAGADPNEWSTPQMSGDLVALRRGEAVDLPGGHGRIEPKRFLVVEDPFGRERDETGPNYDFVACIDVPLEIALARKILRETKHDTFRAEPEKLYQYIHGFLPDYLTVVRDLYREANRKAMRSADIILDGRRPLPELVEAVIDRVLPFYLGLSDEC